MTTSRDARARRIMAVLDEHFPAPAIPLAHEDPYQLLVAVVLSAQCTDARVNMVTPALFARAPDVGALAAMRASQILPFIRTCGLAPTKAKNLSALARQIVAQHDGQVPADQEALERLPGVGHKTASVVMVQAFGVPTFPVDTHIHRLAERWQLSNGKNVEQTERDLRAVFPRERWHLLHLQIIYFGRKYCPARGHDAGACPICSWAGRKRHAANAKSRR
jgi:endonuclease-3